MPKGSAFEREIAKQLTAWWLGDPMADVVFWRSSQSGGRATARKKKGQKTNRAHCGDIAAIDPVGKPLTDFMTLELKRGYTKATIHDLIDNPAGGNPIYAQWVKQARAASKAAGTPYWAIIHRRTRREAVIVMPLVALEIAAPDLPDYSMVVWQSAELAILPLANFLAIADTDMIKLTVQR